jgi:hypothetical protein
MSTPETVVTGELPSSGAPPAVVETPAEAAPPPAAVPSETAEAKEKSGVSKRIDELTRLRRDAERERDRWYETAQRLQQTVQQPAVPKAEPADGMPTLADYGWDEKRFAEALLKRAAPKPEVLRETWRELQEQEAKASRIESFRTREAEFAKEHDDYEEVAYRAPISEKLAEVIQEADDGPELAYYLGKNPDIAKKLSKLSAGIAGIELGKLSAKLAIEKARASEPSVSKTPPPTPKVEGVAEIPNIKSASDPESDKLSTKEWLKLREKEVRRKKD